MIEAWMSADDIAEHLGVQSTRFTGGLMTAVPA